MQMPLTHQQLSHLGWSHAAIDRAQVNGRLVRLRRNGWLLENVPDRRAFHIASAEAARQVAGPGTVLSHWSAAALWGLPLPSGGPAELWITRDGPGGGRNKPEAHLVKAPLDPEETTTVGAIPVTTLARTVNDVARSNPFIDGVMVADAALRIGLPPEAMTLAVRRARRWPGNATARRVAAFADARAESPYESRCRVRLRELGLDGFVPQFVIHDVRGRFVARVDFASEEFRLVLEFDGEGKYDDLLAPGARPADAFRREKERDGAIRHEGWWVEHLTRRDVDDRARFRAVVHRAIADARRQLR